MGWADFLASYKPPKPSPGIAHPLEEGVPGVLAMLEEATQPHHKALITLCGLLGLRVEEARTIRPTNINERDMTLRILGKGSKERIIPVMDFAYQMLLPRLIQTWGNNDRLVPLSDSAARRAWSRIGKRALGHHTSSHDGRMTVGTSMYYNGEGDLRAVQEFLGHANSSTTENYTKVNFDKMREAATLIRLEEV